MKKVKRLLKPDCLLIALVMAVGGFLHSFYVPQVEHKVEVQAAKMVALEEIAPDFGEPEVAPIEPDDVVNGNLKKMPDAAKCEPITFMMLNAHNYFVKEEDQRSRYTLSMKSEESRNAVADLIVSAQPEIVGLVEMGGPKALKDLMERLRKRGLDYPHAKVLTRNGEDRALAVLSMHPIVQDNSRANCNLTGRKRQKMLRGILDVTVKVENKRYFRIVGAHLKSRVAKDAEAANSLRSAEAKTLAFYLQQEMRKQPKMPFVVYGDWNDGPADASLKILKNGISKDSALTQVKARDSRGQAWTIYYAPTEQYNTFDQIYVNAVARSRRGRKCESGVVDAPAAEQASDHRAVWCELR